MQKINLHTHTPRCKHASGTPDEFCRQALELGYTGLGFSDHSPFPDHRYDSTRMDFTELVAYKADIDAAAAAHPELEVFSGLEIDYRPALGKAFYEDVYLGQTGLDYLLGGTHFYDAPDRVMSPFDECGYTAKEVRPFVELAMTMVQSGVIDVLNHPEIALLAADAWDDEFTALYRELIACAVACKVPLEINAKGFDRPLRTPCDWRRYPYPADRFWELAAEAHAPVVLGIDAHKPGALDHWRRLEDYASEFGLVVVNAEVASRIRERRRYKRRR